MEKTLTGVPIIDISTYLDGTDKLSVAQKVNEACRSIGFLVISGHGVSKDLLKRVDTESRLFFALPKNEKMKYAPKGKDHVRGYASVGSEALSYSLGIETPPDLKESFSIGPYDFDPGNDYYFRPEAGPHFQENIWPDYPPGYKKTLKTYFDVISDVACKMMRIFALALDLDENYFDHKIDRHISMLRVLNYPAQLSTPAPNQKRAGAHSDYGSMTIVKLQEDSSGLEVLNKNKEWVPVPIIPDTFVINIGDLMAQWTNDQWVSTLHRVSNPDTEEMRSKDRLSIVFFHQPNYDSVVECLDTCKSDEEKGKYQPITSGDHLRNKFLRQTTMS